MGYFTEAIVAMGIIIVIKMISLKQAGIVA